jgi:hypothetical protein
MHGLPISNGYSQHLFGNKQDIAKQTSLAYPGEPAHESAGIAAVHKKLLRIETQYVTDA